MKKSYSFLLVNTGLRQYNRIAYIISLLNFLYFVWLAFFSTANSNLAAKIFVFAIALTFLFQWIYKRIAPGKEYFFIANYLVLAAGWIFISVNYGMFLLHLLLGGMDIIARQKIYLSFDDEGVIQFQWKFKKNYEWAAFSNIILKDGLLTLDFKNNKIKQYDVGGQVDEKEFNSFCMQKLS